MANSQVPRNELTVLKMQFWGIVRYSLWVYKKSKHNETARSNLPHCQFWHWQWPSSFPFSCCQLELWGTPWLRWFEPILHSSVSIQSVCFYGEAGLCNADSFLSYSDSVFHNYYYVSTKQLFLLGFALLYYDWHMAQTATWY